LTNIWLFWSLLSDNIAFADCFFSQLRWGSKHDVHYFLAEDLGVFYKLLFVDDVLVLFLFKAFFEFKFEMILIESPDQIELVVKSFEVFKFNMALRVMFLNLLYLLLVVGATLGRCFVGDKPGHSCKDFGLFLVASYILQNQDEIKVVLDILFHIPVYNLTSFL